MIPYIVANVKGKFHQLYIYIDPLCFVAAATGVAGTRVAGDVFAIDCNNNRNF